MTRSVGAIIKADIGFAAVRSIAWVGLNLVRTAGLEPACRLIRNQVLIQLSYVRRLRHAR
jgi:hypothetical protein